MINAKALITGGAGSIGIHVIAHIMANTDWDVISLDSFHHKGYRDRLKRLLNDNPEWVARIKEIQTDLSCPISEKLSVDIGSVDFIIHLAALSDVFLSIENPVYTIQNNINSTLVMLEYARKTKPIQFIYFSTDEVYGMVKKGQVHKEWETHRPSNAYSASKAASEDICYAYWRSYGVPVIIVNTMNNFAEMQSKNKFPVIIQKKVEAGDVVKIHGNENEIGTRFYIHSRNTADALLHIIRMGVKQHKVGEIDDPVRYNIVGDKCVSNLGLASIISGLMEKELKYELVDFHKDNPAHDIHYGLDGEKLKATGWVSPKSFEDSLKETIEWQKNNKEWIT